MVNFPTAGFTAGASGSKLASLPTRCAVLTAPAANPYALGATTPLYPARTFSGSEPLGPVPVTDAGADTASGCTAIGLRTLCPRRSAQVSDPNVYWSNAALVRLISMVYVADRRGSTVSTVGVTFTVVPGGACTLAT